jgi:hypothetical protein
VGVACHCCGATCCHTAERAKVVSLHHKLGLTQRSEVTIFTALYRTLKLDLDVARAAASFSDGYNNNLVHRIRVEMTKAENPLFPRTSALWAKYAPPEFEQTVNNTIRVLGMDKFITAARDGNVNPLVGSQRPLNSSRVAVVGPTIAARNGARSFSVGLRRISAPISASA